MTRYLLGRVGLYPDAPKPPCVMGYEVAGDVDALGDGVEGFEVGQRVMGACRFGVLSTGASARVPSLVIRKANPVKAAKISQGQSRRTW